MDIQAPYMINWVQHGPKTYEHPAESITVEAGGVIQMKTGGVVRCLFAPHQWTSITVMEPDV